MNCLPGSSISRLKTTTATVRYDFRVYLDSKCYYFSLFAYLFFQEIDGVRLATSKTEKGFVQIVLTDEENGIEPLTKTVCPLLPLVLDVNH